jgi:hypothetical protein
MPLHLLVLDSDTTAAVIWRGFSWDPEQFPDPKGFFAWAKARGVKVTVNESMAQSLQRVTSISRRFAKLWDCRQVRRKFTTIWRTRNTPKCTWTCCTSRR